jgi:hypothetical protein
MNSSKNTKNKAIVFCFASYKIEDKTGSDPTNIDRQTLYAIALDRLIEVAPRGTGIIVGDNTVSDERQLQPVLQEQLRRPEILRKVFIANNVLGAKNKGAGEHLTCLAMMRAAAEILPQYDWVIYFTSRYPMQFPLVFKYIDEYQDKDAIVANAVYLCPDGSSIPPAPGNYNDVIFAMRRETFKKYAKIMDPRDLFARGMNSETRLYKFVHENKLNYAEVEHWGVFRYDYGRFEMQFI